MKNRFLPFRLISAFTGLSLLLIFVLSAAGQTGNTDFRKSEGSRIESARANQYTGTVNPADVMNARHQAEELRTKSASVAMGLNWYSAGPDNYSGLVWSVIYDKNDPTGNTLYAGSIGGGIWKSTDLGLTWIQAPVQNNLVPRVSSIVQTPNGTIYAATGITSCKNVNIVGRGIFSSQNGSEFTLLPGTESNPDFIAVTKLVVNPQNGRLFAATVGGLYYSDNGTEWTKIRTGYAMDVCVGPDGTVLTAVGDSAYLSVGGSLDNWVTLTNGLTNGLPKTGISWMVFAIAPSDANVMYASLVGSDGKLLNVYSSVDKGANWSIIFPKNPTFEPYSGGGCYANTLVVSPNDPYELFLGGVNMWHGKRFETSGYFNWEEVSLGAYSPWFTESAPMMHHSYVFSPVNSNQIAMATDGGVSICSISGSTFSYKTINKLMTTSQFNSVSVSAQRDYVMGGGTRIGVLAMGYFYPDRNIYPVGVNSPTAGFPIWFPEGLVFGGDGGSCEWSNIDSRIAVFTEYNGSPATRRRDFNDLTYVNDFVNGVRPVDSTYIPMRLWESFNFAQTHDSVKVYARVKTIPADTTLMVESACNKFLFPYLTLAPIPKGDSITIADPIASRFFYYGYKNNAAYGRGIFMTKDMLKFNKKTDYYLVYKDTAAKVDFITSMAVSADLNTVWAGTKLGRLIRVTGLLAAYDSATANAGSSQCVVTSNTFVVPAITNRYVTDISINPSNSGQVLVTLGNYGNQDYVYYSQNAGDANPTFTSVQSNLPQTPVYSGLIEMHGNSAIVGTDLGVFSTTSLNGGSTQWAADMQNIGDVPVTEIRQQVNHDYHILNYGMIYLASYGRGLWMDTTYYSPVGIDPVHGGNGVAGNLGLSPNPVTDNVTVTLTNGTPGILTAAVYDMNGRMVLNTSFGKQPKGTFTGTLNLGALAKGTYIIKIGNDFGKVVKL